MALTEEQMIERVRFAYEAFNRGDFDTAIEVAHPDIVFLRAEGQGEIRGVEGMRAWMEPDAFESQVIEPLEFRVSGSKVLVRQQNTARGAGSGIEMEIVTLNVWTFDDEGRVTRSEFFLAHQEAEALSALEAD
jgi:ketosteroid isomerase-like protein